ncbi:hypothetical protein E3U43_007657, partial [Larimichthys crocea]
HLSVGMRPGGSVLGLCQRLQQMLLHYIKRDAMLESLHSLLMCAFWPRATTSHPVLAGFLEHSQSCVSSLVK